MKLCYLCRSAADSEEITRLRQKAESADQVAEAALAEAVDLQEQTRQLTADLQSARQQDAASSTALIDRDRCALGRHQIRSTQRQLLCDISSCIAQFLADIAG